jgi:hypothetical protein
MARFKVGDKVILGDHHINGEDVNWNPIMKGYVGRKTIIVKQYHPSNSRHGASWYVDADGGMYYWYEANMKPILEYPDQKCSECQTSAPHGEPKNGIYICDFCKAIKDLGEPTPMDKYKENWQAIFGKK